MSYNCYMRPDTNTNGKCQWFFFSLTNCKKEHYIEISLNNCARAFHLVREGY